MKKLFLILSALGLGNAFGQTYLMENFANTTDTLTSNGWTQIGTTATNPIMSGSPALTYTGYVASGIGKSANLTTSGQDIFKNINFAGGLTSGQVFTSFLINVSAAQSTGDYFFAFLPSGNTSSYAGRLYIALSSPGYYKVAMNRWTEARAYSNDSFALNQTYMFTVRYAFNTTTTNLDDSVYLYVTSSGVPTSMPATPTAFCVNATSNMSSPNIGAIALRQGSSTSAATLRIGSIRVATNWNDGPLPVEFTSFKGIAKDNANILSWSTGSETNNKGFEIERSENAQDFESIAFVKGAGNSQKLVQYNFIDKTASAKTNFYRLKQVDFDGSLEYSEIISITSENESVSVTPNPFNDVISIESNGENKHIVAEIIDLSGRTKISLEGNTNQALQLNTQELKTGVYFLRISNGESVQTKRIIKN
ncbi:MAG: T9SS type A sorting domain-containing protein [Bacteroidia bacterium]|nr:T9SS type A sorting domain-containing protein [Bacteroidia bacterium]